MAKTTKKTTEETEAAAGMTAGALQAEQSEQADKAEKKLARTKRTKKADAEAAEGDAPAKPKRTRKVKAEGEGAEKPKKPRKTAAKKKAKTAEAEEAGFDDDADDSADADMELSDDAVLEGDDDMADDEVAELEAWRPEDEEGDGLETAGEDEADDRPIRNGYGELVRIGRSRGWVTLSDINDYLPESALRTSENLQEVTEQLGRLGIQVFEAPPDEDDILINGMGGDNGEDIDEDDAAVMLTPEESVGLSKDPLRAYLRGVGSHKLLTRAGEIEVAKSIEQFTIKLVASIIEYPVAVEEILRLGETLKDENVAVDTVVDGFNDTTVEETPGATDEIATDIGAAAMTVDQLDEMRERVLSLFELARKSLDRVRETYGSPAREAEYRKALADMSGALSPIRFSVKLVTQMTEHISQHMDEVNDTLKRMRTTLADRCRMPQMQVVDLLKSDAEIGRASCRERV